TAQAQTMKQVVRAAVADLKYLISRRAQRLFRGLGYPTGEGDRTMRIKGKERFHFGANIRCNLRLAQYAVALVRREVSQLVKQTPNLVVHCGSYGRYFNSAIKENTRPHHQMLLTARRMGCTNISQGYAFFAYPWKEYAMEIGTTDVVRGILDTLSGAILVIGYIQGVRKKRVRLANIPTRLRRAVASSHHASGVRS